MRFDALHLRTRKWCIQMPSGRLSRKQFNTQVDPSRRYFEIFEQRRAQPALHLEFLAVVPVPHRPRGARESKCKVRPRKRRRAEDRPEAVIRTRNFGS